MKQTAVEWLVEQLSYSTSEGTIITHHKNINEAVEQAKEMEKEQIVDFAYVIADDLACGVFREKKDMEKRYEEFLTFRSKEDND
jgi:hypothetical protein